MGCFFKHKKKNFKMKFTLAIVFAAALFACATADCTDEDAAGWTDAAGWSCSSWSAGGCETAFADGWLSSQSEQDDLVANCPCNCAGGTDMAAMGSAWDDTQDATGAMMGAAMGMVADYLIYVYIGVPAAIVVIIILCIICCCCCCGKKK